MRLVSFLGAAAMVGVTTAAHAGYYVSTVANTGRGYNRGCVASYNASGGTGAQFQSNDGGQGPCNPAAFLSSQGATVTVTGSTDTTGTLTASHDESSVVALPDSAAASSAADLSTGQVKLSVSAANFSEASSSAHLYDTLHFTVAGAASNTVTLIPVSFSFNGSLLGTSDPSIASGELNYSFGFGNAQAYEFGDYQAGYYGYNNTYPAFTYVGGAPRVSGWDSYSFSSYDPLNTQFSGVYAIIGATADVGIDFSMALRSTKLGFDSAGAVSIGNVDGVSYTSDSGVFLQAAGVAAVPEPATWAMMIAGFGMVGGTLRRRRTSVRFA